MPFKPKLVRIKAKENRPTFSQRYAKNWKAIRRAAIIARPFCEMCKIEWSTQVHHKDMNRMNNNEANLMAVCASCHSKHHKRQK